MRKLLSAAVTIVVSGLFVLLSLAAHAAQPAPPIRSLCDHTVVAGGHVMAWVTTCRPSATGLYPSIVTRDYPVVSLGKEARP